MLDNGEGKGKFPRRGEYTSPEKGGVPLKWDPASVRYGTLLLTATGLVNQLLGFVYRILLSRLVGAEVMGLYQLVMPVFSVLLSVTAIGLTAAVANLTAEYRALGREGAAEQVLRRCMVLLACLLVLPTLALFFLSDPISVYILASTPSTAPAWSGPPPFPRCWSRWSAPVPCWGSSFSSCPRIRSGRWGSSWPVW